MYSSKLYNSNFTIYLYIIFILLRQLYYGGNKKVPNGIDPQKLE